MAPKSRLTRAFHTIVRGEGSVRFRDFEALLNALGFALVRQRGSHRIYIHPRLNRPFPVQPEGGEAKRYQIRQLRDIIMEHGLTLDPGE